MSDVRVEEVTSGPQTCPYCKAALRRGEPTWTCPRCATVLHEECLRDLGGCTSLGCEAAANLRETPPPPFMLRWREVLTGERIVWGLLACLGVAALAFMLVLLRRVAEDDPAVSLTRRPPPPVPMPPPLVAPVAPVSTLGAGEDDEIARLQREIQRQVVADREERAEKARIRAEAERLRAEEAERAANAPVDPSVTLAKLKTRGPYPEWLKDADARDAYDLKVNGENLDPEERRRALAEIDKRLAARSRSPETTAAAEELRRKYARVADEVAPDSTWTYAPTTFKDPDIRRLLELELNSWREMDPEARERTAREIRELEAKVRRRIYHPNGR